MQCIGALRNTTAVLARRSLARSLRARALSAAPPVGVFSAVRVVPHANGQCLVTARPVMAGEIIFRFSGMLIGSNTGDRCLRVGERHYLTPAPEEDEPPWVFLNHSYSPSVELSHPPVEGRNPPPPVLTATATAALPADTPMTFDYNLHEYMMFDEGFSCEETGRPVRGFHFLAPEEQEALLLRVMPFVKTLHGRHLFGSESRC